MEYDPSISHLLVNHISKKHPFIYKNQYSFRRIFTKYFSRYTQLQAIENAKLLAYIKANADAGVTDLGKILEQENGSLMWRYLVYHKKQCSDFAMFKFMEEFYGEPIEKIVKDLFSRMTYHEPPWLVKHTELYQDIKDILKLNLLMLIGYILFMFKMSVIFECAFSTKSYVLNAHSNMTLILNINRI